MRLRKVKNVEEKILNFPGIIVYNAKDYNNKWNEYFQNDNPIYIEIGMGKGKFINEMARRNPDINFIGCEIEQSVLLKAAEKLKEENINNLRLINLDAKDIKEYFGKNEIDKLFLNFSDPWPKSRHEKRRLTFDTFLNSYLYILKEDGIIEMKSDNKKLFEYSLKKFNEFNFKFLEVNLDLHLENDEEIITTEYEDKFKSLGKPIYFIKLQVKES